MPKEPNRRAPPSGALDAPTSGVRAADASPEGEVVARKLAAVLETTRDGVWTVDAQGYVRSANPAYCVLVGRAAQDVVGKHVSSFSLRDRGPDAVDRNLQSIVQRGGNVRFDTEHRHADGRAVAFEASATYVAEYREIVVFLRDVTHQRRAEEAERALWRERVAAAARLSEILELTRDGFWVVDEHGFVQDVNGAYCAMLGMKRSELLGRHVAEISRHAPDREGVARAIDRIKGSGHEVFETEHVHADGHLVPVEASATWVEARRELVAFIRDIGERKRVERAERELRADLEAAARKHVAILETTHDGFWTVDGSGRITSANDAYCEMVGMRRDEVLGRHLSSLDVHDTTPEAVQARIAHIVEKGHARFESEHRHANGSVIAVEVSVSHLAAYHECVVFVRDVSERKRVEAADRAMRVEIEAAGRKLDAITSTSRDGFWVVDRAGTILEVNDAYCAMVGRERSAIVGSPLWSQATRADIDEEVRGHLSSIAEGAGFARFERTHQHADGREVAVEISATHLAALDQFVVFVRDVTERKSAELAAAAARAEREVQARKFEAITQASLDGFFVLDADGCVIESNEAYAALVGWDRADLRGRHVTTFASSETPETIHRRLQQIVEKHSVRFETVHWHKNGSPVQVDVSAWHSPDDGTFLTFVRDISERKRHEQAARHAALYDVLTELPNRRMLIDRFRHAVSSAVRKGQHGAVMYLDLDQFKALNDAMGHDAGDAFLREVARRLQSCVRDGDTVARLGGDEFVVLLEELSPVVADAAAQAEVIAERIREALKREYRLRGHVHRGSSSIGIALFQSQRADLDAVLAHADSAMYQAKQAGRDAIRFFDVEMQAQLAERAELDREIRAGLAADQFELHFQVQVDAEGVAVGAEALVRWNHHERGLVPPGKFIPLIEENGFILQLGAWVLRAACRQLSAWHAGGTCGGLPLSVNVSAKQFGQADFVDQVRRVLDDTGAPAHLLKLELTESTALRNVEQTIEKMHALKALGVRFAMDDFGTGYSSLTYLKRLPFDELKIDRAFVVGLASDGVGAAIVKSIVAMSQALGIGVVAEGVETEDELRALRAHGCGHYQGYYFGRPAPIADFEARVRRA